jgi:hypothetical protein
MGLDIKGAENKLDDADSFLTKLGIVCKKHWGKLLIIALMAFVYWAFTLPDVPADSEEDVQQTEEIQQNDESENQSDEQSSEEQSH